MDFSAWHARVAALAAAGKWQLTPDQHEQYARFLESSQATEDEDQAVVLRNYHADHAMVIALQHRDHPDHNEQWATMLIWIRNMVYKWQFSDIGDYAVGHEDLIQNAANNIAGGLADFHYRSQLTTWASQIVLNVIRRHNRDRNTKGRKGGREELNDSYPDPRPIDAELDFQQLHAEIDALLRSQGDQRLAWAFQLYYVRDRTLAEIGKRLGLSIGRVSMLLKTARGMLRADPSLRQQAIDAGIIFDESCDT